MLNYRDYDLGNFWKKIGLLFNLTSGHSAHTSLLYKIKPRLLFPQFASKTGSRKLIWTSAGFDLGPSE